MRNPKNIIFYVGARIDIAGCIVNSKFCNNSVVLSIFDVVDILGWSKMYLSNLLMPIPAFLIWVGIQ